MGTILEVPVMVIIIFWDLYGSPLIQGNCQSFAPNPKTLKPSTLNPNLRPPMRVSAWIGLGHDLRVSIQDMSYSLNF